MTDTVVAETMILTLASIDFAESKHRQIFSAIAALLADKKPADIASVNNYLYTNGTLDSVGRGYVLALVHNSVCSAASAQYFARQIKEESVKRAIQLKTLEFQSRMEDKTISFSQLVSEYLRDISELQAQVLKSDILTMEDIAKSTMQEIDDRQKGKIKGINIGIPFIDDNIGGFMEGELITLAGVTGVGKTNLALQFADFITVQNGIASMFVPLEMVPNALFKRLILNHTEKLNGYCLRTGKMTGEQAIEFSNVATYLMPAKLYIPESVDLKFTDLAALIRKAKLEYKIQAVFIDYMQLLTTYMKFNSDASEIAFISKSLKTIARDNRVVLFSVSQFRKLDGKKMATIDDLKGSSSIPQDSDFIIYIHRDKLDDNSNAFANTGIIELAKAREGKAGYKNIIFRHPKFFEEGTEYDKYFKGVADAAKEKE